MLLSNIRYFPVFINVDAFESQSPQSRMITDFFVFFPFLTNNTSSMSPMPAILSSFPQQRPFYFNVKNLVKITFCYFDVINLLSGHKYDMLDMNREGNDYAEANAEKA